MTPPVSHQSPRFGTWYKITSAVQKNATDKTRWQYWDTPYQIACRFADEFRSPDGNKELQTQLKEADPDYRALPTARVFTSLGFETVLVATGNDASQGEQDGIDSNDAAILSKATAPSTKQMALEESKTHLSELRGLDPWHPSSFTIMA